MKISRQLWRNEKWFEFCEKIKNRDKYTCLECRRSSSEVVLQVHHTIYIPNKFPWEYSLSDCRTLCKGCHAKEHGLIEPGKGWILLSINDLGNLSGTCERKNCGKSIRYEHLTYHPSWGYKTVGSTCIEHLTEKDKALSSDVLKLYKTISKFVHNSEWHVRLTKKNKKYLQTIYNNHLIKIYGRDQYYSFQVAIKRKGQRWYDYKGFVNAKGKGIEEVKEMAYIVLKGTTSNNNEEKAILRKLFKSIR
ncbi:MAG: HNH endonuclease [bacterium]